jgi:hypothetical protein
LCHSDLFPSQNWTEGHRTYVRPKLNVTGHFVRRPCKIYFKACHYMHYRHSLSPLIFVLQRSVVAGNVEAALVALIRSLGESFSSLVCLITGKTSAYIILCSVWAFYFISLEIIGRHSSISRESTSSHWRFFKIHWKFSKAGRTTRFP